MNYVFWNPREKGDLLPTRELVRRMGEGAEEREEWLRRRREGGGSEWKASCALVALPINGVAYGQSKPLYNMACKEQPYFLSLLRSGGLL